MLCPNVMKMSRAQIGTREFCSIPELVVFSFIFQISMTYGNAPAMQDVGKRESVTEMSAVNENCGTNGRNGWPITTRISSSLFEWSNEN